MTKDELIAEFREQANACRRLAATVFGMPQHIAKARATTWDEAADRLERLE